MASTTDLFTTCPSCKEKHAIPLSIVLKYFDRILAGVCDDVRIRQREWQLRKPQQAFRQAPDNLPVV